jgi:hypothetical protein
VGEAARLVGIGEQGSVGGLSLAAVMLAHLSAILYETCSRRSIEVSLEFSRANALHDAA